MDSSEALESFIRIAVADARSRFPDVREVGRNVDTIHAQIEMVSARARLIRRAELRDELVYDSVGLPARSSFPRGLSDIPPRIEDDRWWWNTYDRRFDSRFSREWRSKRLQLRDWDPGRIRSAIRVSSTRMLWIIDQYEAE